METCRACLSTGMKMVPMDEKFIQKYNMFTGLDVRFPDNIPVYTCKVCFDGVTFCIEFRNKCIASDLAWKEVLIQKIEPIENLPLVIEDEVPIDVVDTALAIKKEEHIEYQYNDDNDDCFEYSYDELFHESKHCIDEVKPEAVRKSNRCKTKTEVKIENLDTKKTVSCGLCELKFEDRASVSEHLEKHKKDTECERCHEPFTNLPHLLSHRLEHVPDKQKFCHICNMKFLTAPGLEFHYMRKHEMAKKDEPIACKKCGRTFTKKKPLLQHIATLHSGFYKCEHCGKGFGAKFSLRKHLPIHSQIVHKCDLCDYTSKLYTALNVHKMKKHTEGRLFCQTCKRGYGSKARLDKHVCKSTRKPKHMCPACGRYISGDINCLRLHMMTHDEIPRFKCEQCSATFKTKKPYMLHMDKHAGKPRHECKYCQRKFYSANVLTKHKRVHTGEKPYVCKICSKGFTANHNLKVHMKVHGITNLINRKEKTEDLELLK